MTGTQATSKNAIEFPASMSSSSKARVIVRANTYFDLFTRRNQTGPSEADRVLRARPSGPGHPALDA